MANTPQVAPTTPMFDVPLVTRTPKLYRGGAGDWRFQFSMPGLVNYTDTSPAVRVVAAASLTELAVEFNTNPSSAITLTIIVNGIVVHTQSGITGDTLATIAETVATNDKVQVAISNIGAGDADGMWVGIR